MRTYEHRRLGVLAAVALLGTSGGLAAPAVATEGSLYGYGVEALVAQGVPDDQCSVAQTGASFGVTCPPIGTSLIGTKWQIDLRSPVGGSVIEGLSFSAVRFHKTATSIAEQVLGDGALAWQAPESDIPVSPAQPKPYAIALHAQTASLRLYQTEARQQPNRVWTFLYPTIAVRDTEAPTARWTSVPEGWVTGPSAQVGWQTSDNFGSDGLGAQRITAAGPAVYSAAPGQGAHIALLDLGAVPDGPQTLRLQVDGDGTAAAPSQDASIRIDRTPPVASVSLLGLPDDAVRATVAVNDATSGVRSWSLHARSADGPPVASSAIGQATTDIDLGAYASPGETIRFVLEATDNAGLSRQVVSAPVTRPAPRPGGTPATTVVGGDGPLGEPGRIEASGTPLPDLSRIQTRGIRTSQALSYSRTGRLLVPLVGATYSRPMSVSGCFLQRNGRGLHGASVYLVNPKGYTEATAITDRRGHFGFRVRPLMAGTWRAVALGRPLVVAPAAVVLRPLVTMRVGTRTLRAGGTLRLSGAIAPRRAGRRKLVTLEWRLGGTWRPLQLATADRFGRFKLSYRFPAAVGGYTVPLRIVVPREKGWPFLPVIARRFNVHIRQIVRDAWR